MVVVGYDVLSKSEYDPIGKDETPTSATGIILILIA